MSAKKSSDMMTECERVLSLIDVVSFCKEARYWLGAGLLLGLCCSMFYLAVIPKVYEARLLFQGARIQGADLESSSQLIERLKFPTFYDEDQFASCGISSHGKSAELGAILAGKVSTSIVKGTNILQLSYRATERALAVQCLGSIVDRLLVVQNKQADASLKNAKRQVVQAQTQLSQIEQLQSTIEKRLLGAIDVPDSKFAQVMLAGSMLSQKDQIAILRKSILEQSAALEPPLTRPAELIEPIYASEAPVSPKGAPFLLAGMFGGAVFAGYLYFVRRSWKAWRGLA